MSDKDRKTYSLPRNQGTQIYQFTELADCEYEDRTEKPRQRVPSSLLIVAVGVYFLLAYLAQLVEDDMPAVVRESDLSKDNSDTFSEEVALRYLARIVGEEPRVAGTQHHLTMTRDLKAMIDDIAVQANLPVRTDWQIASGDYHLGLFQVYDNVSNIVALLEGESSFHPNGTLGSSILINCHYDSVPFALGASDNAVFCAVMAESLTKLSRRRTKLKRNIIFLFNGAEENGLQGSHAFLQHPWAKGVTAVINLDAAGMNGKATVFQVSDPRVLNAYRRSVPRPNAQGLAEFVFTTGLIPSDTDFRIWRTFGDIQGLVLPYCPTVTIGIDIAFSKWAHVYHTRNDRPDLLLPGVLQCAGNMILALLTEVATADDLETKMAPSAAVYYDYLNLFMLTYSFRTAYLVDALVALCGLTSVGYYVWMFGARWSTVNHLLLTAAGRVAAMIAGVVAVAVFVPLMVATTIQMRYLTNAWIVVPLYWMPYLIAGIATAQAYDAWLCKKYGLSRSVRCLQAMAATRLLVSWLLLLFMCFPALSSLRYLITVPLLIMSVVSFISMTVVRKFTLTGWQHLLLEMCFSIPSVMFMFSLVLRVDALMLPTMNRSASDKPDYTVAILNVVLAVFVSSTVSGIELLFSRKRLWSTLSTLGLVCIILMFIPFNPYEDDGISVQRHNWFQTELVTFDANNGAVSRSTGIKVLNQDPYTLERVPLALAEAGYKYNTTVVYSNTCEEQDQLFCGLPMFRTGFVGRVLWLHSGGPAPLPAGPQVHAFRSCAEDYCSYNFTITTTNHNLITLWPIENVTVTAWSLTNKPSVVYVQGGRPVYMIYQSTATYGGPIVHLNLDVTFNVSSSLQTGPMVDLSLHAHKIHHPEDFTEEYRGILAAMPRYFNIATFLSYRRNYRF